MLKSSINDHGPFALRVCVDRCEEEAATAALWDLGTSGIEIRERPSGVVQLISYFSDVAASDIEQRLTACLHGRLLSPISRVPVIPVDWEAQWRDSFHPVTIGEMTIAPPWITPTASRDRWIVIEPGRAFGTGTHETTQLCLELLHHLARDRGLGCVVDVGTGTGLLAIAAHHLGAESVIALDIDPDSLASARAHSRLNQAPIRLIRSDGVLALRHKSADVVVANITAPWLISHCAELRNVARRALILTGFLSEDVSALEAACPSRKSTAYSRGEWAGLLQEFS
jgi:ribosomal protein L11 methyltransferase